MALTAGLALGCSSGASGTARNGNGSGGSASGSGGSGVSGSASLGGATGVSGNASGGAQSAGGSASGGSGATSNAGGSGAVSASGGASSGGSAGSSSANGGAGGAPVCQMANYTFQPKIPTVFLLVDQSGSMFGCRTQGGALDSTGRQCANHADTSWYPLRDGVLQVVQQLGGQVRFGFSAFTGEQGDAMCPVLMPVLPALNNYDAISTQYNSLMPPRKGETPTRKALEQVKVLLDGDSAPGDKFILFVTDGQPDYCDDGNNLCPPDSVVGELQNLVKANIKSLVFGISSPLTTISDSVLQAFANAGGGQPTLMPGTTDPNALYDQCNSVAGWSADFATTGKPSMRGQTIGDYSTTGGNATVYKPDLTNQSALVNLFSAALSGVKSCTFDLSNVNGQSIKVDLNQLDQASVAIQGTTIPLDMTNGWSMASATQLVLNGTACDTWRMPNNNDIAFNFPCKTIIFE